MKGIQSKGWVGLIEENMEKADATRIRQRPLAYMRKEEVLRPRFLGRRV